MELARHTDLEEARLGSTAAAVDLGSIVEVVGLDSIAEGGLGYGALAEEHRTDRLDSSVVVDCSLAAEAAAIVVADSLDSSVVVNCSLAVEMGSHPGAGKASLIYSC